MKAKKIITTIIISAIVIVAAYFYSFVNKTGVYSEMPKDIPVNGYVAFTLTMPVDNVNGIIFNLSDCTKTTGMIKFYLEDEDGNQLISKETVAEPTIELKFDRIKDVKGKKINMRIECSEDDQMVITKGSTIKYMYRGFRAETMIVSILCVAYLFGLAKVLNRMFRK